MVHFDSIPGTFMFSNFSDSSDTSHLDYQTPRVNTSNDIIQYNQDTSAEHITCVKEIQAIVNRGYSQSNGAELINYIQRQRSTILEIMVSCFAKKPTPSMADSMNTLFGQMEKSVRDERKEALKAKELETSKETFELFRRSLENVIDGTIKMPTFEAKSLTFDPLSTDKSQFEFKDGEFDMGVKVVDTKEIEEQLQAIQSTTEGSGSL